MMESGREERRGRESGKGEELRGKERRREKVELE